MIKNDKLRELLGRRELSIGMLQKLNFSINSNKSATRPVFVFTN